MDIYTLNRANRIKAEIKSLKEQKDIWEGATGFSNDVSVWNGSCKYTIRTSLIDFKELKNRTLAYINSKIEALEKEFKEL